KIDDLALYVASMDSKLYALDRSSAKIRWQYFAGAPLRESPVVTANSIYQVVPNVGVVALDKTEGKYNREPKWIARGAKRFVSESEKYAFVVSGDNHLVAYEKATGEPKFKSKRTDLVAFAINTKDAMIFAATADGAVMGIQPVVKPGAVGAMVWLPV